jgi:hypothetical protein
MRSIRSRQIRLAGILGMLLDQSGKDIASIAGGMIGIPNYTDIDLGTQYFSF